MTRDEILEKVAAEREELQRLGVRSLALFGSHARNEATEDSDVDFLVEIDGPPYFDRYCDLVEHLEGTLRCKVDLVFKDALHPALRSGVRRDHANVPGLPPILGRH